MAIRTESDQVFQPCFLRLLPFAQRIQVVGLHNLVVVIKLTGDTSEAISLLGAKNQLAASPESLPCISHPLALQFSGVFLIPEFCHHGRRALVSLSFLPDP